MTDEHLSPTRWSPDEAFSALGNDRRVQILRELGAADEPLALSELYDRLELTDSAQFNYHLDKLLGHFVHKVDESYALARPGERIIEAIRSGAVTDEPQLARTTVEQHCSECERELAIQWQNGSVEVYCTDCESRWDQSWGRVGGPSAVDEGYLGRLPFPPAGLENRSPTEIYHSAQTWVDLELAAVSAGLCPRCSATVDRDLRACTDHEDTGRCSACERPFAVTLVATCTNCIYAAGTGAVWGLLCSPELLSYLFEHDLNPFDPEQPNRLDTILSEYDERVLSTDPLEMEFTLDAGAEPLTLRVDEELTILNSSR